MIKQVVYIDESVKDSVTQISSKALRFYQHMLKWKFNKSDVEEKYVSWLNTIIEASNSIRKKAFADNGKPYVNIVNRSNEYLYKAYVDGGKEAKKELNLDVLSADDKETYNDFCDISKICDKEYLRDWLKKYARTKRDLSIINKGFEEDE